MSEYKRMTSYLFHNVNGVMQESKGFAKMELMGGKYRLTLQLTAGVGEKKDGKVYLLNSNESMEKTYIGVLWHCPGGHYFKTAGSSDGVPGEIYGVQVEMEDGSKYTAIWNRGIQQSVQRRQYQKNQTERQNNQNQPDRLNWQNQPERQSPQDQSERQSLQDQPERQNNQNQSEKQSPQNQPERQSPQNQPDRLSLQDQPERQNNQNQPDRLNRQNQPERQSPQNQSERQEQKPQYEQPVQTLQRNEVKDDNVSPELPSALTRAFRLCAEMNPFNDDEITDCVALSPEDIGLLPVKLWRNVNNSFLLHGYYSYGNLLYARRKNGENTEYMLMVPGINCSKEARMAQQFGFPMFKPVRSDNSEENEFGKKGHRMGEFGYWYLTIGDDR